MYLRIIIYSINSILTRRNFLIIGQVLIFWIFSKIILTLSSFTWDELTNSGILFLWIDLFSIKDEQSSKKQLRLFFGKGKKLFRMNRKYWTNKQVYIKKLCRILFNHRWKTWEVSRKAYLLTVKETLQKKSNHNENDLKQWLETLRKSNI